MASSGLTATYTSSNPAIATINAAGQVTILSAGNATINALQIGDINHTAAKAIGFSLQVNKKALSITANNSSKVYDGLAYSGGNDVIYSGFVNGQDASKLIGSLSYMGTSQGAATVGSYFISPTGYTADNYAITYYDGSLIITKAVLTVTVNSNSMCQNNALPNLTANYTGFKNGDTESSLKKKQR